MLSLSLSLLGPFHAALDGQPIVGFESNKVRALLAYLAVQAERPHSRDELIGLLWPDQPDATARANLRQALANLRQVIGDRKTETPFLLVTSESIQFQRSENCRVDATTFTALSAECQRHPHRHLDTCRSCTRRLQAAVELYQGDFLAQFIQSGSEAFEEWTLLKREQLHQAALDALYHLTQHCDWRGEYDQALRYARRQLELDPWREEAHRQAMHALVLTEQRSAALAQYEVCRHVLSDELGAEPSAETAALYEQIKSGTLASGIQRYARPTPPTPLIGREGELAEVNAVWHKARAGEGQVLLISGEPGIGKTRLMHELMAQERYSAAYVLWGECYAEGGAPYAPLAQAVQVALDLWETGNLNTSTLADLITLIPALRERFPAIPPSLPLDPQAEQQRLFDSVASFFAALSARAPVLLLIEDAHWADNATLALLRHLARRARRVKLLIVVTQRDVVADQTPAFRDWLSDLQRERLATPLALARLDQGHTRNLLAALFQGTITPEFLDGIYGATEGNPFFVTEVCQALIDEGTVYRAGDGWQRRSMAQIQIPKSVRLAIQQRVGQLPEAVQDTLQRAAVLGREFEFDALQAMSDFGEDALIDALETAERAQLIDEVTRASQVERLSFTFVHALIPSTLHDGLSTLRRQRLHHRAAQVIEQIALKANRIDDVAAQLAQHFTEADEIEKAIEYWLKAGERAQRVYAYDEAIVHYQQALALSKEQGATDLTIAARTAMKLGTLYHTLFDFDRAQPIFDEAFDLWEQARTAQLRIHLSPAPHALRKHNRVEDVKTLDPLWAMSGNLPYLVDQLFTGLIELTAELDIVPAVARAWEVLEGGRKYVFHLRGDLNWSNDSPITAWDFEYAWKRVLHPANMSPLAEYFFDIRGAKAFHAGQAEEEEVAIYAVDDWTLVVELVEPTGDFLYLLATTSTRPVPRKVIDARGKKWSMSEAIVTNGPFRVKTWVRGKQIVLTRDPNYRGPFGGNLVDIELTPPPVWSDIQMLQGYRADLQDIGWVVRPNFIEPQYEIEHVTAPRARTGYLSFDMTRSPFSDSRVRQAFAHAIDRQTLVDIYQESTSPITGGLIPPGIPGYSPEIGLNYDPDRARHLLAEAGYANGRDFPMIDAYSYASVTLKVLEYLQERWRTALGVDIAWKIIGLDEYVQLIHADRPYLCRTGWIADYPDPDAFLRMALRQPENTWHDVRYEHLLNTARRLSDQIERLKMYH